ncbi:MAG: hypothetical protein ACM3VS_02145 [Candidatus Dadabacteria bacterium]
MIDDNRKKTDSPLFDKQDAPLKNTDKAYVQVKEDGSPYIPASGQRETTSTEEQDNMKPEEESNKNSR